MKALQFHVTLAVPDGFVPPDGQAETLRNVIKSNLAQIFTDAGAVFTRPIPPAAEITVTEEGRVVDGICSRCGEPFSKCFTAQHCKENQRRKGAR